LFQIVNKYTDKSYKKRAREEERRKLQKGGWRRSGRKTEKKINRSGKELKEGTRRGRKVTNA